MLFARKMLLTGMLTLATIAPVLAAATDTSAMAGSAVVCTKSGKTMVVPITPARQAELLASAQAHPLDNDVVVLVSGGKTYVIDEHVMASGKGMIASILSDFMPSQGGG
jgi:hypothetical protein